MAKFIGGAWPYANGSLHIGHIVALIPGDVIARYYRLKGESVLYVSGSDCHGTPIAIRAKAEGVTPKEIANKYHSEFKTCFEKLNFSFDYYGRTDDEFHKKEVQQMILNLYEKGYIYEKEVEQLYCEHCDQFLPDRYVEGICPICQLNARGDQCDHCGTMLDPLELLQRVCKLCSHVPVSKKTSHLYFSLSKFSNLIEKNLNQTKEGWRINAVNNTQRYLDEGLCDRAISRDLSLGIDIPIEKFKDKKVYVWIDAVLGYLTMSKKWALENNVSYEPFWNEACISYYVHGKDNIPFHSIILPALLGGIGENKLPDKVISSEYLTLEGKKISTSLNWAVWVPYLLERYDSDSLRYFFIINGPEKRDTDFSWLEFINSHNGELLGAYGNLVNRTLVFTKKFFDQKVPEGHVDLNIKMDIDNLYSAVGTLIENGQLKIALEKIFEFIRSMNKFFDTKTPWLSVKTDETVCQQTIYQCLFAIINVANLLSPFLPESSEKIMKWFSIEKKKWEILEPVVNGDIKDFSILFERLDKCLIQVEQQHLLSSK